MTMSKFKMPIVTCYECGETVGPNCPHREDCSRYGKWGDYEVTAADIEWYRRGNTPNHK